MTPDAALAARFWDEHQQPGLSRDGVPDGVLEKMRTRYIDDVLGSPEAVQQLRREYPDE